MSANPAPPAEGATPRQVRYSEMIALLTRYVRHHEATRESFERAAADAGTSAEREACLRFAARSLDESEVCAAAFRVLWLLQTDKGLRAHLREVADRERGHDFADPDEIRYE